MEEEEFGKLEEESIEGGELRYIWRSNKEYMYLLVWLWRVYNLEAVEEQLEI